MSGKTVCHIISAVAGCTFESLNIDNDQLILSEVAKVIKACFLTDLVRDISSEHTRLAVSFFVEHLTSSKETSALLKAVIEDSLVEIVAAIIRSLPEESGSWEELVEAHERESALGGSSLAKGTDKQQPPKAASQAEQDMHVPTAAGMSSSSSPERKGCMPFDSSVLFDVIDTAYDLLKPQCSASLRGSSKSSDHRLLGLRLAKLLLTEEAMVRRRYAFAIMQGKIGSALLDGLTTGNVTLLSRLTVFVLQLFYMASADSSWVRRVLDSSEESEPEAGRSYGAFLKLFFESALSILIRRIGKDNEVTSANLLSHFERLFATFPQSVVVLFASYDCAPGSPNIVQELVNRACQIIHAEDTHGEVAEPNFSPAAIEPVLPAVQVENIPPIQSNAGKASGKGKLFRHAFMTLFRIAEALLHNSNDAPTEAARRASAALAEAKGRKTLYARGILAFNEKPKLDYFFDNGILSTPKDPNETARFLMHTVGLDKQMVGEYLAGKTDFHKAVLKEYIHTFDLVGHTFIEVFRAFIESFNLPGDSNLINRIVEVFGEEYCAAVTSSAGKEGLIFANSDAVYVLCYAVIMLNVDQHKPEIKVKMTQDEFVNNLRGINNNADLPRDFLESIYRDIKESPMRNLELYSTGVLTPNSFADLRERVSSTTPLAAYSATGGKVQELLLPFALAAMRSGFLSAYEDASGDRLVGAALAALQTLAELAIRAKQFDLFDSVILYLCRKVALHNNFLVSALSNSPKFRETARTIIALVCTHGAYLRSSWNDVFSFLLNFVGTLRQLTKKKSLLTPTELAEQQSSKRAAGLFDAATLSFSAVDEFEKEERAIANSLGRTWLNFFGFSEEAADDTFSQFEEQAIQVISSLDIKRVLSRVAEFETQAYWAILNNFILFVTKRIEEGASGDAVHTAFDFILLLVLFNKERSTFAIQNCVAFFMSHFSTFTPQKTTPTTSNFAFYSLLQLSICFKDDPEMSNVISVVYQSLPEKVDKLSIAAPILVSLCRHLTAEEGKAKGLTVANSQTRTCLLSLLCQMAESSEVRQTLNMLHEQFYRILHAEANKYTESEHAQATGLCKKLASVFSLYADSATLLQILELLFTLAQATPVLPSSELSQARFLDVVREIEALAALPRKEVCRKGVSVLQAVVLHPPKSVKVDAPFLSRLFEEHLLPFASEMLKVTLKRINGIGEIRPAVISLLLNSFMSYFAVYVESESFLQCWENMLGVIHRYAKSDQSSVLKETTPELLLNALLVVDSNAKALANEKKGGALVETFWEKTWACVSPLYPELRTHFEEKFAAPQQRTQQGSSVQKIDEIIEHKIASKTLSEPSRLKGRAPETSTDSTDAKSGQTQELRPTEQSVNSFSNISLYYENASQLFLAKHQEGAVERTSQTPVNDKEDAASLSEKSIQNNVELHNGFFLFFLCYR